jgi:CDP-glycerol glycerophosphotransferase (TagB/SpsB family)
MKQMIKKLYQFLFYKVLFNLFKMLPVDENKIIYISHYGNRFGCNPKSMFDHIKEHYPEYKNVIVLNKPDVNHEYSEEKVVGYYSISFLRELATSKYWVVNTNLHPDLAPRKETVYLQTWHAAGAFKKFGLDLPENRGKEKESWEKDTSHWTKLISSSESIIDTYASACGIDKNKIHPIGLPRNDIFFQAKDIARMKGEFYTTYNIPEDKKIILYAPTYRDTGNDNPVNLDFSKLQKELGNEYVFVLKLHPFLANYKFKASSKEEEKFVLNLSAIDDIQDLLLIADVLITDYSSVIFDFAITGRPMIFYSYDLEAYERGFYFDYKETLPGPIVFTQDELAVELKDYQLLTEKYRNDVLSFAKEYNAGFDGKSTEKAVKLLLNK